MDVIIVKSTGAIPQTCPTPGSAEARDLGCRCPVRRNNDGHRPPFAGGTQLGGSDGGWYVGTECPMHASSEYRVAVIVA